MVILKASGSRKDSRSGSEDLALACALSELSDQFRFEFTLIIPSTLAPHDWHYNGSISHDLYAEVVGIEDQSSYGLFNFSKQNRKGKSPAQSRSRSRSPAPSHTSMMNNVASLSITRQEISIPQTPSYTQSEAVNESQEDTWLKGVFDAQRTMMFVYNPNPNGGIVPLDERCTGDVSGLGVYDIKFSSDVVSLRYASTIAPPYQSVLVLNSRFDALSCPPTVTFARDDNLPDHRQSLSNTYHNVPKRRECERSYTNGYETVQDLHSGRETSQKYNCGRVAACVVER